MHKTREDVEEMVEVIKKIEMLVDQFFLWAVTSLATPKAGEVHPADENQNYSV